MTRKKRPILLLAGSLVALLASAFTAQPPVARSLDIPTGRPVLLDGRIDPDEWSDARVVPAGQGDRLYLKRDARYLYVAIARSEPGIFGVNLYLRAPDAAEYVNLHASAKLGERRGRAGAWPEWIWWTNRGWTANVARGESFAPLRFLPDEAKEIQIQIDRLPGRVFELTADIETSAGAAPLRLAEPEHDGLRWLTIGL